MKQEQNLVVCSKNQMYPQDGALGHVDIWSDVPPDETLDQVNILSDFSLVRHTPSEASGQVDIWSDPRSG